MRTLIYNNVWMTWNLFLAYVAVFFAYFAYRTKNNILAIIFLIISLIFAPNTIYINTDLVHLFSQWKKASLEFKPLLFFQYLIFIPFGFLTYLITLNSYEKLLKKHFGNKKIEFYLLVINFFIAFGVVVGRVQRANSWEVLTNPRIIISNIIQTISSFELIFYTLIFYFFSTLLFFAYRMRMKKK